MNNKPVTSMDSPEELLSLVDSSDEVIGTIRRAEVLSLEANGKGYVRCVNVFLVNDLGQIWIPTRQPHKKIAPNGYDFSASGHVGAGQTYEAAALKEMSEELNINAKVSDLNHIGVFDPIGKVPYFHHVYLYKFNGDPIFNNEDFAHGAWKAPSKAIQDIQNGHPAKDILLDAIKLLV